MEESRASDCSKMKKIYMHALITGLTESTVNTEFWKTGQYTLCLCILLEQVHWVVFSS